MKRFVGLLSLLCLLIVVGCVSDDPRAPGSREAWLDATGGEFDGSLPD